MTELKIVIALGSPSSPSKSASLANLAAERIATDIPASIRTVDIYALGSGLSGAIFREDVSAEVEAALELVENADLLITACPVFRGSYPGMFKHFFDLVDVYALANKLVLLTATGGSASHMLVIDQVLRPLFGFFQSLVAPVGLYASSSDFDGTIILNNEIYSRIELAAADLIPILRSRKLTD